MQLPQPEKEIFYIRAALRAGLRVSELASIKISDIDFDQRIIKILGKGRKERLTPFNDEFLIR